MKIFNAVEIEINHGCNRSCSYCPNSVADRIEKGSMEPKIYQSLINQLRDINFKGRISYDFYNEPMLSTSLESYVALARDQLPEASIELYTNGTLLSLERFKLLDSAGVTKFIVTRHEGVTNYVFDVTLGNLSMDEREKVLYRNFTELHLTNRGGTLSHISPKVSTQLFPCHIPSMMLTVTVKGNVVPCFEDFYQKNQMGNILDKNIMDIWLSPQYVEFREKLRLGLRHKYEACNKCSRTEVLE